MAEIFYVASIVLCFVMGFLTQQQFDKMIYPIIFGILGTLTFLAFSSFYIIFKLPIDENLIAALPISFILLMMSGISFDRLRRPL